MKVGGRACSMGVDSGVEVLAHSEAGLSPGSPAPPGLEALHNKGASKVRFSVPSMEFVWETGPDGNKKVTFLVGGDGEPVVVVLGAGGTGGSNAEDVDHLLQEQAWHQADQEADMIKKAAEEELDKLVKLSRSTVAKMEQDATKANTSKVRDATREAVVQSLQEATMEMERHIRALEEVAPSIDSTQQQVNNNSLNTVNGSAHTNGELNRLNGSPTNDTLQIVNGTTNGSARVINGSMSNTTESSTDTNGSGHIFSSNDSESSSSMSSLSSLSTLSDPSMPSPSTSPPSLPAFTISSYGGRYSPPHKLNTPKIWSNDKVSYSNTFPSNKPPITTPKPVLTTKTSTTVSSTTTLRTHNGTIVATKNANNITTTNGHNISQSITNNQSTISKTCSNNSNNSNINNSKNNNNSLPPIPPTLDLNGGNSFSNSGSTSNRSSSSSNSITPPSSMSSNESMASLPPSPPPSVPSSPTSVSEDCLKEEIEAMERLEAIRAAAEASEIQRIGVAAQIRRWEQFSEGSLEALKTATLERAKKRRQREILENLRHQVEVARRGQGNTEDTKNIPERDDQAWQEQERKAKESEVRIRDIARRAREEHRRGVHTSPNGAGIPHAHAINRNLNGVTQNSLFKSGINDIGIISTNGDINGNIRTFTDDLSNNNSDSSSSSNSKNGRTCVRQKIRPPKPPSRAAIVNWFREEELTRGSGLDPSKSNVAPWFHGIISRTEAEEVLSTSTVGSFLVRVSERIWGYAISFRGADRCRHYLIDVENGKYTFFGSHNTTHDTLNELVSHHSKEPITSTGGELLTIPRGQVDPCRPDYLELFTGTHYLSL